MANPLYERFAGRQNLNQNPMKAMQADFEDFRARMSGKSPETMMRELVGTGRVTQDMIDRAQSMAQQIVRVMPGFGRR